MEMLSNVHLSRATLQSTVIRSTCIKWRKHTQDQKLCCHCASINAMTTSHAPGWLAALVCFKSVGWLQLTNFHWVPADNLGPSHEDNNVKDSARNQQDL